MYSTLKSGKLCHELDGVMSAQIVLNSSAWEISLSSVFVCFSKMLFIYLRKRGEKKHEREGQREREKQVPC